MESRRPLDLAIVVPTYKEFENVETLVERISNAITDHCFEIIFVDDDSPDGTADLIRKIARNTPFVRCLHRVGRRGQSSACIEGMMSTAAPFVAVIDGDLQHDENLLPRMLEVLREHDLDVVVGSRFIEGGGFGDWAAGRLFASKVATSIARRVTKVELTDPMSGFFMMRTETLRRLVHNLSGVGFKILLDIFASASEPLKFRELPYEFQSRGYGESKLDCKVLLEFLELLFDKAVGRYIPAKFVMFGMVGSLGVAVHMSALTFLFRGHGIDFQNAQIVATLIAMSSNFLLNNVFTYYDQRLSGWSLVSGWLSFCAASSVGAVANVGIAVHLFYSQGAAWAVSAIAGIMVGVVWNYAITSIFTWKRKPAA